MKSLIRTVLAFVVLVLVACATPPTVEEAPVGPPPSPTAPLSNAEIDSNELFRSPSPVERSHVLDELVFDPDYDSRYNREYSWPKSLGFDAERLSNPPYSDVHHLFATYNRYNSSRYDEPYGVGEIEEGIRMPTKENLGRGGDLTAEPESSNYRLPEFWQTWIGRRGDVARATFYMDIRDEGDLYGSEGEPNLEKCCYLFLRF